MLHRKAPTLKMEAPGPSNFIIGNFYQTLRRHIFSALLIPLLPSKFLAVTLFAALPYVYCLRFSLHIFHNIGSFFSFLCIFSPFILVCPFLVSSLPAVLVSCPLQSAYSPSNTHIKPVYYITGGDTTTLLTQQFVHSRL
jgi:hypothetical protein